jgi:hypothetical protein
MAANLTYILARLARRSLPRPAMRGLLDHGLLVRPGMETSMPERALERYVTTLQEHGHMLAGKRVLVLGYGGHFAVGVELLRRGAAHVVLCDPFAPPNDRRNERLLPEYAAYLQREDGHVVPLPERITLLREDVRRTAAAGTLAPVDIILTNAVFEHLDDVESVTGALAALTGPSGLHLHFIDLSDHFRKYPFEMLCYSDTTWRKWLNPGSNLNRYRLGDYRRAFETWFAEVDIEVLRRSPERFRLVRARIRPEFLTGDENVDSATYIRVIARGPRRLHRPEEGGA